jgi:D-arabinose 1-dehydrogenase-like Zn-dependent alcohol dehydrogenase
VPVSRPGRLSRLTGYEHSESLGCRGAGTIGVPRARAPAEAGHAVTALTRSADKQQSLPALGATPVVADALNDVVLSARPTHVIHQLTALPRDGPRRASDLAATNRLRIDPEGRVNAQGSCPSEES